MSLPITNNSTQILTTFTGSRYVIAISGNFGGGSLAVNWLDSYGDATGYPGSPATSGKTFSIIAASPRLQLVLTGATSPTLEVECTVVAANTPFGDVITTNVTQGNQQKLIIWGSPGNEITRVVPLDFVVDSNVLAYLSLVEAAKGSYVSGSQLSALQNFVIAEKAAGRWGLHKRIYLRFGGTPPRTQ